MLSYIQYQFCFFTGEHIKLSLGTEEVKVCLLHAGFLFVNLMPQGS